MKFLLFLMVAAAAVAQTPFPLRITMISLGVKDAARSSKFYGETLGLTMLGPQGEVTLFKAGEITIVLNEPSARSAKGALSGSVEVIFPAESVAAAYKDLVTRGCYFVAEPHEISPGMWAATFTDPDGHKLTILGQK